MMKRKGGKGGFTGLPTSSQPPRTIRRRRRSNNKCSPAEVLLYVFFTLITLTMGYAYYYHFAKEPPMEFPPSPNDDPYQNTGGPTKKLDAEHDPYTAQLFPKVAPIPINVPIPQTEVLIDTVFLGRATTAGIILILRRFVAEFRMQNIHLVRKKAEIPEIIREFHHLAKKHLLPMEELYRGEAMYPQREDDSLFMSLAAFREHLLYETLAGAFKYAKNPDKLFVGVVVQNCFGKVDDDGTVHAEGKPCRTGAQVVGKNAAGKDQTKVSDAPPDPNGVETFCADPDYKKYCDEGQIRALYIHETESLGPAMARYFASKLWSGETYFMQSDSHLQFAEHWDAKFIAEVKLTKNYPKSVLSSYPPGFAHGEKLGPAKTTTHGARLCSCEFSTNGIEQRIIRIGTGSSYKGGEEVPSQIPFIAAGFFFARAEFLVDVPFDPLLPWCFMGEEIALSVRAWTYGWDIYAPRMDLINHQYRPGRMGLPKFWGTVNRLFRPGKKGVSNNGLQGTVVRRVKNLVGYKDSTSEKIEYDGFEFILNELENFGLGKERTLEQYLAHAGIDMETETCTRPKWCVDGTLL